MTSSSASNLRVIIPGGSGQVGRILSRAFRDKGYEVMILARTASGAGFVQWDGKTIGPWTQALEGADAVINLAGKSVNCRYTKSNLKKMMDSRVESTRVIGEAIAQAKHPPRVWLQASTATIYEHTYETVYDETARVTGGDEPDVPKSWGYSIEIARAWESELERALTPQTRKVALRSAMIMSPDCGGIFETLLKLTRAGLGGSIAGGKQYVSWIHEADFCAAVDHLLGDEGIHGIVNVCAPNPLPQRDFMEDMRSAWGTGVGIPAAKWMTEIGAFFLRTDTELILKSRRVVPGRLIQAGFKFKYSTWDIAARDLVRQWRQRRRLGRN